MKMKKLIEVNLPILSSTNIIIGTYSRRYNTRSEAKRHIFALEADGFKFKDPFDESNWEVIEVPDESDLQ